jgi:exopolysaccharide production protein ExoZ
MTHPVKSKNRLLEGIQYVRGIAAMMVVFHHARHEFGGAYSVVLGARGVEVFFVISGLVMMYSTRGGTLGADRTLRQRFAQSMLFWKRRFLRVAPLYWLALLLSATFVYGTNFPDLGLLQDVLFIPHWNKAYPDQLWPTLVPGWSLNYEMFFYLVFGLSFLFERWSVWIVCGAILALSTLSSVVDQQVVAFRFYTNPVMLHFVAGVLLYYLIEALGRQPARVPPRWCLALLLAAGFIGLALSPAWAGVFWLPLTSALIVASAVLLFDGVKWPALQLLGDASYSVYLFHLMSFLLTKQIVHWTGLSAANKWGVLANFAVYLAVAAASGIAIHLIVEKPFTERVSSLLRRKPSAVSAPTT